MVALGPSGINIPLAKVGVPAVAHVMPLARREISARMSQRAAAAIFIAAAGATPTPALEYRGTVWPDSRGKTRRRSCRRGKPEGNRIR